MVLVMYIAVLVRDFIIIIVSIDKNIKNDLPTDVNCQHGLSQQLSHW